MKTIITILATIVTTANVSIYWWQKGSNIERWPDDMLGFKVSINSNGNTMA